jgi:osmotically-inducible protein OsmY
MKAKQEKPENKELRNRVEQHLGRVPNIVSTDIGVAAADGIVTLSGYVGTYAEKLSAEKAALHTRGVRAVANDICVRPLFQVTDPEIAATAVAALHLRTNIPEDQIKVTVKDGRIYLDGQVSWKFQIDAAESAMTNLPGMTGVVNRIELTPAISIVDVKEIIEAALRQNTKIDARQIRVASHDDTVELWGNVRNWFEKHEADLAARSAPGVTKVENHLHVMP